MTLAPSSKRKEKKERNTKTTMSVSVKGAGRVCARIPSCRYSAPRLRTAALSSTSTAHYTTRPQRRLPRTTAASWTQTRLFSVSRPRRNASEHESFDPRTVERESDEVDVCIVGGGAQNSQLDPRQQKGGTWSNKLWDRAFVTNMFLYLYSARPGRSQRRDPLETARKRSRQ